MKASNALQYWFYVVFLFYSFLVLTLDSQQGLFSIIQVSLYKWKIKLLSQSVKYGPCTYHHVKQHFERF